MAYHRIDSRTQLDEKFRTLTDDGKLLFYTIISHPSMTAIGAFRITIEGFASEMRWKKSKFERVLAELTERKMVEVNPSAAFFAMPNWLKYNPPNGPNSVVKAWRKALDMIPECHEKRRLAARCFNYLADQTDQFYTAVGDDVIEALQRAIMDGIPHAIEGPSPTACNIQKTENRSQN